MTRLRLRPYSIETISKEIAMRIDSKERLEGGASSIGYFERLGEGLGILLGWNNRDADRSPFFLRVSDTSALIALHTHNHAGSISKLHDSERTPKRTGLGNNSVRMRGSPRFTPV